MARMKLSYDEVRAVKPDIIYCGMFGFGQNGRYAKKPAYDPVVQGSAGVLVFPRIYKAGIGIGYQSRPFAIHARNYRPSHRHIGLYFVWHRGGKNRSIRQRHQQGGSLRQKKWYGLDRKSSSEVQIG